MSFIDGLSSGLDTSTIISQLMEIERRPQVALSSRRSQEEQARTELSGIRSDVNALRSLASDLRIGSGFEQLTAVSSDPDAVSVNATAAADVGSVTFQVTKLATAASVYTTNTFASVDDVVAAPGASVFNASGFQGLGFESLAGTGFGVGAIDFSVVQASAAAEVEGVGIPAIPIEVDGTNDAIDFSVSGFHFSVTLEHGEYTTDAALASAVAAAISNDATASQYATASLSESGGIKLTSLNEGSAVDLVVTGGSALGDLGLTAGQFGTGTDGIVEVNGAQTVVTDTTAGGSITLDGGGGASIEAVIAGPIREGTATVSQDDFGGGTLSEVVATINSGDLGYRASAVDTGSGYRLQLTATETGAASAFTPDAAIFGALSFTTLSEGTDAELTIQGDNPFTITSATNTFSSVLDGVDVTVNDTTTGPVTVSSQRDVEGITENVQNLVDKMNEILNRISAATANQPGSQTVLQGNREARRAADQLRSALTGPIDGNALSSVGIVGIELTRDGALTFDADRFADALVDNPDQLAALFSAQESGAEPGVLDRLIEASDAAASVGDGYLYTAGEASERRIDDYGRQIDAFERRFEVREASLRRTYANLEVALGSLQQQQSYLASQLSSLGGTS